MPISKDEYTLKLTQHQARGLKAALALVNQILALPPNRLYIRVFQLKACSDQSLYPEMKLLHEEVIRQLEEQDEQ